MVTRMEKKCRHDYINEIKAYIKTKFFSCVWKTVEKKDIKSCHTV